MKFYYNDKLIRKSKTNTYTHAVISSCGVTVSCHTTREAAEKKIRAELARNERVRKENNKFLAGRPSLIEKANRRCDAYKNEINNWQIVKLEARD